MSRRSKSGWDFLNSNNSGYYNGADGSRGYKYSDGSGYWNGADGSRGYKYSDGSGYYDGADGSHGVWYSDGKKSYDGEDDSKAYEWGSKIASGIIGMMDGAEKARKSRHRVQQDSKFEKKDWILLFVCFGILILAPIVISVVLHITAPKAGEGEIKVPSSASAYKGEDYEQVKKEFENMGFTNIECVPKKDLVTGWLKKKNTVDRVSIDGDSEFGSGEIFKEDAEVVITYHSFKKEK